MWSGPSERSNNIVPGIVVTKLLSYATILIRHFNLNDLYPVNQPLSGYKIIPWAL